MAILSISICNKSSKIIFARQFIEMSRKQLEEHIVAFSRNVDIHKDSTYFENDKSRYLYIPIESLFLILISTKDSNIIEDMEVIKLSYRLITDLCGGRFNEGFLVNHSFELALALDDVISLGYRDGVNLVQVKQYLGMDSIEEKEFRRQQEQREKHAKEQLHIQMKELEKQKKNKTYLSDAIGSDSIKFGNSDASETFKKSDAEFESDARSKEDDNTKVFSNSKVKAKGLSLGKKKNQQEEKREGNSNHLDVDTQIKSQELNEIQENEEESKFNPLQEPIRFEVEERIKGEINKDGEFKKFEIKGEGFITVLNPSKGKFAIEFSSNKPKYSLSKIDKKLFDTGIISPENKNEGFVPKVKQCIFKYTIKLKEDDLPFNFNSFVSSSGNFNILNLTCEYNYTEKIKNINRIALVINVGNQVNYKCDDESKAFLGEEGLIWEIGELNESKTPSIEIKSPKEISELFPIYVRLRLDYSIAGIKVGKSKGPENEELLLQYNCICESAKEDFRIVFD